MDEINKFIDNSSKILKILDKKPILKAIKIIKHCRDRKGKNLFSQEVEGSRTCKSCNE